VRVRETVELPQQLPIRPSTAAVLRDPTGPCRHNVGNVNSLLHAHLGGKTLKQPLEGTAVDARMPEFAPPAGIKAVDGEISPRLDGSPAGRPLPKGPQGRAAPGREPIPHQRQHIPVPTPHGLFAGV